MGAGNERRAGRTGRTGLLLAAGEEIQLQRPGRQRRRRGQRRERLLLAGQLRLQGVEFSLKHVALVDFLAAFADDEVVTLAVALAGFGVRVQRLPGVVLDLQLLAPVLDAAEVGVERRADQSGDVALR